MITLVPWGGLCNRLRVLLCGISFQQSHPEVSIVVEWFRNSDCFCNFDELFVPIQRPNFKIRHAHWWAVPNMRRNLALPKLVRLAIGYGKQYDAATLPQSRLLSNVNGGVVYNREKVYISTYNKFVQYDYNLGNILIPLPSIKNLIDEYTRQFDKYTVGIHIRRTDNVKAINNSPLEMYHEYMQGEIGKEPEVKFFLSTDDLQVKEEMEKKYGKRIITQHNPIHRDNVEGMIDAVVDLWCLKATDKLIGSYWSSFTDMAIELGGMPYVIVKK